MWVALLQTLHICAPPAAGLSQLLCAWLHLHAHSKISETPLLTNNIVHSNQTHESDIDGSEWQAVQAAQRRAFSSEIEGKYTKNRDRADSRLSKLRQI